jgi:dienelactone hydrolase
MLPHTRLPLGLLVLLLACRPAAPPVPLPTPHAASDPEVETREAQVDGDFITVRLHIPPTPEHRKPTVISLMGERRSLLRQGYLVVTYRINWEYGKRPLSELPSQQENTVGKWVLASPSADVLGKRYFHVVATNADHAIPKILAYLSTVPEVDMRRVGIVGSSTNGFVVLQAVARDRRLAAAVVLTACGDYHAFLRDSSLGMNGAPLALDPDYDRWLRSVEPIRRPRRIVHAAVLMVNRDGDPVIPIGCANETARVLRRAYMRARMPERFRYRLIESPTHGLDTRDTEETIAWLGRWLQAPQAIRRPRARRRP